MPPTIKNAIAMDDYNVQVLFDNGESGTLDMQPYLEFGIFKKIKDKRLFKQLRVAFGTIEWGCGVDIDPEFVYIKCVKNMPSNY